MVKKQLSKSETKEINDQIAKYELELDKKAKVMYTDSPRELILQDETPVLFKYEQQWIPTLYAQASLKTITIDMGAIPFIAKGADLMRPGVKACEAFLKEEIVVIIDEKHGKKIAIGIALFASDALMQEKSGKVAKIIHKVGDVIWNAKTL